MIQIEDDWTVEGWEHAIRGMRNPMNSWDKSDSEWNSGNICESIFIVGDDDLDLMNRLSKAGQPHRKFARMLVVWADITAPLYWWKEFDTYKVGTVRNSCSTMHKIHSKEFTLDDFSTERMDELYSDTLNQIIEDLNVARGMFNLTKAKVHFDSMIQMLPSSYNQKATVMMSYETLINIYAYRRHHKLDEWQKFCDWVEGLPHWWEITQGVFDNVKE